MTKFEDANDPGFAVVTGELRRWVKHSTVLDTRREYHSAFASQAAAR